MLGFRWLDVDSTSSLVAVGMEDVESGFAQA